MGSIRCRFEDPFMRRLLRLVVLSLAIASSGLQAQDSQSLDGTWHFTMQVADVKFPHYGEVVLNGTTGTWKIFARRSKQLLEIPCIGRVFPLKVLPSEPEYVLTFKVLESDVLQGCSDIKVALRAVAANKLEGTTSRGYPITMERD
jgi:hypothetical protein